MIAPLALRCDTCEWKATRLDHTRIGDRCTNPHIRCEGKLLIDRRPNETGYMNQSQGHSDGSPA